MSNFKHQRLHDIKEIIEKCNQQKKALNCFITLNGGMRTSKDISFNNDTKLFSIYHQSDEAMEEDLTIEDFESSFTGKALKVGALYIRL